VNHDQSFYVGGSASTSGMPRAVLSEWQIPDLAASQELTYLGATFPLQRAGDPPSTIIEISGEPGEATWQHGFYCAACPPQQFDDTLRSLDQLVAGPVSARAK
jgi:hypothetical protein